MQSYAEDLLETSGFMLTCDESAYVVRNTRTFSYNYSTDAETTLQDAPVQKESTLPENILNASPQLAGLAADLSPEEAFRVNATLREALAVRGPDGLRQFLTAAEYEECDTLHDVAEVAAHLDCYGFIDIDGFREATIAELLSKGVDKRALCCFDYETYAALTHDFGFIHTSKGNGMYLCKTDQTFQLPKWREETGLTGPAM